MKTNQELTKFNNIPAEAIGSINVESEERRVVVLSKMRGLLVLTDTHVMQLIKSFSTENGFEADGQKVVNYNVFQLLQKLYECSFAPTIEGISDDKLGLFVERNEVLLLKELLEQRINHCEHERDRRSDAFIADTYITMKFMLLDIREWLVGEIKEIDSLTEEPKQYRSSFGI